MANWGYCLQEVNLIRARLEALDKAIEVGGINDPVLVDGITEARNGLAKAADRIIVRISTPVEVASEVQDETEESPTPRRRRKKANDEASTEEQDSDT